ncbi:MAG TPA: TolC family protein [Longimicrobiaceae bacterium]|nr:TolC family protein [Longimicrobiaceae bacterium]
MKRLRILPALLALASPLAAQEAPRRLTLDEALRTAEENNPAYRSAQSETRVASARERQSLGAFLPQVSSSVSLGGTSSVQRVGEDEFGNPFPSDRIVESTNSSTSHGMSLDVPLFQRGRMGELQAARADRSTTAAGVQVERGRLRGEVTRRYHDALRAERMIELEERLLASARERLEATQRLFRIAAQGMTEVLGAEVEVARQEQAVEQARGDARKTRLLLGETVGTLAVADAALASEPAPIFDPAALRADSLVALALRVHPRVAQAASAVTATGHRASAARGQRWPTLSARAGYSRSLRRAEYDAVSSAFNPFDPFDRSLTLGFSLSLPVFDQFRTSLQTAQADAARTRAQETLRSARLTTEREVRSALIDLENAFRGSRLAERAARLSQERLEMAREQYRASAIRFTDLQAVVDRTAQAERDALRARFEFASALATLEERVGAPVGR